MLPTYPRTDFQDVSKIVDSMGSFWSLQFDGRSQLDAVLDARFTACDQLDLDSELTASVSGHKTIKDFIRKQWIYVDLRSDELEVNVGGRVLTYADAAARYGDPGEQPPYNRLFNYGDALTSGTQISFRIPPGLVAIPLMVSRTDAPGLTLVSGVDYSYDPVTARITMAAGTLVADGLDIRTVYDDDGQLVYVIRLWAFGAEYDADLVYRHYGYAIGVKSRSGTAYHGFVNSYWDAMNHGPNLLSFSSAYAWAYGVSLAVGGETVESVLSGRRLSVVTDARVYVFGPRAVPVVAPGQYLNPGDSIVDTVRVSRISGGLPLGVSMSDSPGDDIDQQYGVLSAVRRTGTVDDVDVSYVRWQPESSFSIRTAGNVSTLQSVYSGPYVNTDISAAVVGLPAADGLRLRFDVLMVGTGWTGMSGNSRLDVIVNGITRGSWTFSNVPAFQQSYPVSGSPAGTGSRQEDLSLHSYSQYGLEFDIEPSPVLDVVLRVSGVALESADATVVYAVGDFPRGVQCYRGTFATGVDALVYVGAQDWPANVYQQLVTAISEGNQAVIDGLMAWELARSDSRFFMYPASGLAVSGLSVQAVGSQTSQLGDTPSVQPPAEIAGLPGITLGPEYISGNYTGSLYFKNAYVPLTYAVDANGRADVRFELSGLPDDIEEFWRRAMAVGVQTGMTFARLLDTRRSPSGEPGPGDIPRTINPMLFVLRHLLHYNILIIRSREAGAGDDAPGDAVMRFVRKLLPPQSGYLAVAEVDAGDQVISGTWGDSVVIGGVVGVAQSYVLGSDFSQDPGAAYAEGVVA